MPQCPECYSTNVGEAPGSPEERNDGQGWEWKVIHSYFCRDCGCEWTEELETTRTVTIDIHGMWYDEESEY